MSERIVTSTDVLNDDIDEIERLEKRVAELESAIEKAVKLYGQSETVKSLETLLPYASADAKRYYWEGE